MKAVGVIRLGFQFMVGFLSKKANQQMLIKFLPVVGMFITLSLVYNMSWVRIAAFNKISKNLTTFGMLIQFSLMEIGRYIQRCQEHR